MIVVGLWDFKIPIFCIFLGLKILPCYGNQKTTLEF